MLKLFIGKIGLGLLLAVVTIVLVPENAFAKQIVLVCKSFDKEKIATMANCGQSNDVQCKNSFEQKLNNQYGRLYEACQKLLGQQWNYDPRTGVRFQ